MHRYKKTELLKMAAALEKTNDAVRKTNAKERPSMLKALQECQQSAIDIGTALEEKYQAGAQEIVSLLEVYCEDIYQMCMALEDDGECRRLEKKIRRLLPEIKNRIKYDFPDDKKEVVFLPYKASMWDSLESIYLAARGDERCEAYVVPIPYFDKKPDGSFGAMHYEGGQFPADIPVTSWQEYLLPERKPDIIYFHNPYDQDNYVTSVHPAFYSENLKKFTECLVYVPYYTTSGAMGESRRFCRAYLQADYIVTQAPKYRKFFDASLPDEKFLPYGSPKFDRVIRKCQNPPEPPKEWKAEMERQGGNGDEKKKVYFFNTSINGMLADTKAFFRKMEYVFRYFQEQKDALLLWRPHPLLESTLSSMRPEYVPVYEGLKKRFLEEDIGILDTTPDITDTIALCDAYVGDAASSVVSLFGIAGKPVFILNNGIHSEPGEEDWRGGIFPIFQYQQDDRWMVTQGNQLYYAKDGDHHYRFFCRLSEYALGLCYNCVLKVGENAYLCPRDAQDILLLGEEGIKKRIPLKKEECKVPSFYAAAKWGKYILLIPYFYPAVVRFDTETEETAYFRENIRVFVRQEGGEIKVGGTCIQDGHLYVSSPADNLVYALHIESGRINVLSTGSKAEGGSNRMVSDGKHLWLLPCRGRMVTEWDPQTGGSKDYSGFPDDFICRHPAQGYVCDMYPLGGVAAVDDTAYLAPWWGNQYLKLDKKTGVMSKWEPPFHPEVKNEYFPNVIGGIFRKELSTPDDKKYFFLSQGDKKLYSVDFGQGPEAVCTEIPVTFDVDELKAHEPGFSVQSEGLQYCCLENAFNSLPGFLSGNIVGGQFDRQEQIAAYEAIAANCDGSCGAKVHEHMMEKIQEGAL